MDIYLLRHGETDWNRMGKLQGHTDTVLNEHGRAQVRETAEKLCGLGLSMDAIVSSPLKRARESAEIAASCLDYPEEKIVVEPLLIERCFGEGEGMTVDAFVARYETGIPNWPCPGMESREELAERAERAFRKIVDEYQQMDRILLASHGAMLFAFLAAVLEEPVFCAGRDACIPQTALYRIHHENGKNSIDRYEDGTGAFARTDAKQLEEQAKIYL